MHNEVCEYVYIYIYVRIKSMDVYTYMHTIYLSCVIVSYVSLQYVKLVSILFHVKLATISYQKISHIWIACHFSIIGLRVLTQL